MRVRANLALLVGAFVVASGLAGLFGADNMGVALSFGQIAFALAAVFVLVRR